MRTPEIPFAVLLLFLSAVSRPQCFTDAADPLYTTVFVVGPDPRPLVPANGDSPQGDMNESDDSIEEIDMPLPSIPISELSEGVARALKERRTGKSGDWGSTGDRATQWKPEAHRRVRSGIEENVKPRSLQNEVCSITNTFLGFNYSDDAVETRSTWIPPDPHGAVGMSRLVAVGNSMMEVRQKDGTLMFRASLRSFFSAIPGASDTTYFFDPKVIYDEHEGRFVMVALQFATSRELSRIWLAVSKDETPDTASDWYPTYINSVVAIYGNNAWADYPGLEVDEEAVYVTSNLFGFSRSRFLGVRLWVINKGVDGGFYSGGALSVNIFNPYAFRGHKDFTMPTQVHGSTGVDGSVGTFLCSARAFIDGLIEMQIVSIFNPLSASPTFTIQKVSLGIINQILGVPMAPQLGTAALIDTGGSRVRDAIWRNNKLWVVFTISPRIGKNKGQATAHWVRFGTSGGAVSYEAQGDLGGESIAASTHTYYPSVAVNSQNVVAYGYAASSPTTYAGAYASVGTSENAYTVKSGLAPYNRSRGTPPENRWGDYTGISVDPTDDSFWLFNQYADTVGLAGSDGDGIWGTAWGRLACVTPPVPSPVPSPVPYPCGFLGLRLFCPLTFCGRLGRMLGFCSS